MSEHLIELVCQLLTALKKKEVLSCESKTKAELEWLSCENKINVFSSLLIGIAVSLTPSKGLSAPRSWIIINLLPELLSA